MDNLLLVHLQGDAPARLHPHFERVTLAQAARFTPETAPRIPRFNTGRFCAKFDSRRGRCRLDACRLSLTYAFTPCAGIVRGCIHLGRLRCAARPP